MQKRKRGFTLVELSIVLVIIGLLIGGILVGQSMITTANITATVKQISQFDAGVESFKTKYGYLPGDAPMFGGDGNGSIALTPSSGAVNNICTFACEIANFWYDWDSTRFPGGTSSPCASIVGTQPVVGGTSGNVPASKLGSSGSFFIASAIGDTSNIGWDNPSGSSNPVTPQNYYAILASGQAALDQYNQYHFRVTTSTNSAVKPVDALALDTKMDDGVANAGNVISGGIINAGGGLGGIYPAPGGGICSSGATYTISHTGYECTPLIRIGGAAGDPQ